MSSGNSHPLCRHITYLFAARGDAAESAHRTLRMRYQRLTLSMAKLTNRSAMSRVSWKLSTVIGAFQSRSQNGPCSIGTGLAGIPPLPMSQGFASASSIDKSTRNKFTV